MTITGVRLAASVSGEERGPHRWWHSDPWLWYTAAALVGAVALLSVLMVTLAVGRAAMHPRITPSVKASLWKPNAGDYCAGLGELSTPLGQNALYISTVANAGADGGVAIGGGRLLSRLHPGPHPFDWG